MCQCLPKRKVKTFGLVSTLFFGILSIICIFVQAFDYRELDMSWTTQGLWRFTAIFQLSSIVFVFAFFIMAMSVFAAGECKTIQIIYIILGGMSTLFSFAISAFTLSAGAININEFALNCRKNYTGVFEYFRSLDNYFHLVDQHFCTVNCPCLLTNQTAIDEFNEDPEYGIKFNDDEINSSGQVTFSACPENIRWKVLGLFTSNIDNLNDVGKINEYKLYDYWKRIEEKFKCVGWCSTSYRKEGDTKDTLMTKYLFSNINGGIVRNRGCMKQLVNWIPKMLNTFGSVLLLISIGQGASVVFAISLFTDMVLEGSNYPDMTDMSGKQEIKIDGYIGGNKNKIDNKETE